ncbi:SAM domain-containing [Cryptosporidium bovis]|uniref:SAM domain-containing n=1 Tax=Cryptosporidium bovis TaxID=310047 RepID=UPI003519F445|nr:SAM domain-containing [Cryptosporidium bovis]
MIMNKASGIFKNEIIKINKYCYYYYLNYYCGDESHLSLGNEYLINKKNELELIMCFLDDYSRFVGYKKPGFGCSSEYSGIMIALDGTIYDSTFYSSEQKFINNKIITKFELINNGIRTDNQNVVDNCERITENVTERGSTNELLIRLLELECLSDDKDCSDKKRVKVPNNKKLEHYSLIELMEKSGIKREYIELVRNSRIKNEELLLSPLLVSKKGVGDIFGIKELGYRIKMVNCIKKYRILYKRVLSLKKYSIKEKLISLGFNNEVIYNTLSLSSTPLNSIFCSFSYSGINIPFEQLVFIRKLVCNEDNFDFWKNNGKNSNNTIRSSYYLGKWLGKEVAIKVFKGKIVRPELWENTCKLIWSLRHPNLVLTLGFCHSYTEDIHCVVTEYINSGSLNRYLSNKRKNVNINGVNGGVGGENARRIGLKERVCLDFRNSLTSDYFRFDYMSYNGGINIQDALKITKEIACGCYYLNQKGFFHLNLKPSNILLVNKYNVGNNNGILGIYGTEMGVEKNGTGREITGQRNMEEHINGEKCNDLKIMSVNDELSVSVKLADIGHFLLEASFYDINTKRVDLDKNIVNNNEYDYFSDMASSPKVSDSKILNYYPPEILVKTLPTLEPAKLYMENKYNSCKNIDSYSLGVMLWEMVYGELPFSGMDNIEIQLYVGYIGLGKNVLINKVINRFKYTSSFTMITVLSLIKKMCGYSSKVIKRNVNSKVYKLYRNSKTNNSDTSNIIDNDLIQNQKHDIVSNTSSEYKNDDEKVKNIRISSLSSPLSPFSFSSSSSSSVARVDRESHGYGRKRAIDNINIKHNNPNDTRLLSSLLLEIAEKSGLIQTKRIEMIQIIDHIRGIEKRVSFSTLHPKF